MEEATPRRRLSLLDSTSIIVGVIIGVGIYETAPTVASGLPGPAWVVGIWLLGGLLSLCGALCYAELATAYPKAGGDFVYLGRAYGPWAGDLFGWAQMLVIRPGDIALMAFVFGGYATQLGGWLEYSRVANAAAAVVVITAINLTGFRQGKGTQNVLTVVKIAGLMAVVGTALFSGGPSAESPERVFQLGGFELALILVLFTYGGWTEMAYVAAEVKDPKRNIVRALVLGTVSVTAIYVIVNGAFLFALGQDGMAGSKAVAVDAVRSALPGGAATAIACLVCLSALGAMNGMVFSGARISYALGTGNPMFRFLGSWDARGGMPVRALALQGAIAVAIVLLLGRFEDALLFNTPVLWVFFLATGVSLFVLRRRDPGIERPYRVTGYPVIPLIYGACCVFLIYSSVSYAISREKIGPLLAVGLILVGVPVTLMGRRSVDSLKGKDSDS